MLSVFGAASGPRLLGALLLFVPAHRVSYATALLRKVRCNVLCSTVDTAAHGRRPRDARLPQRLDQVLASTVLEEPRAEDAGLAERRPLLLFRCQITAQPFVHPACVHARQRVFVHDGLAVIGLHLSQCTGE